MDIYLSQSFQNGLYRKYLIFHCLLLWLIIEAHPIHLNPCYASTMATNGTFISMDIKRMPLEKVCAKILNETEYEIIFDRKWKDKAITIKLDNVALTNGLRRIIKVAGIKSYALVHNNNQIKVFSFESTTSNSQDLAVKYNRGGGYNLDELEPDSMLESSSSDIGIRLSLAELEVVKEAQKRKMQNLPKNTVVTPPSDSGRGLTLGELEALQKSSK